MNILNIIQIKHLLRFVYDKINGFIRIDLKERWIEFNFVLNKTLFNKPGQYRPIEKALIKSYNKHRNRSKQYLLCHAPYKNLYFQMDGNVVTCCNNRFYSLGKYPENAITDIWNGSKLKRLRNNIANNDLSLGCNFCYSCIKANNYRGMPALAFDGFNINNSHPISLELELDNTCNLECIMCCGPLSSSVRKNRDKLPPIPKIYDDKFVENLKTIIPELKRVKFIGGEPFLIDIYYKIWHAILDINPKCIIELQTNATVLNTRIKELLNKGNFRIGVSLDSLNKETYERIRLHAHFESVMENIEYFSNYSKRSGYTLSVSVCPMRINWKEIPELIKFCNDIEASIYFNTVVYPIYLAIWSLDSSGIKEIKEYYENSKIENYSSLSLLNWEGFMHLINQIKLWFEEAKNRENDKSFPKESEWEKIQEELVKKLQDYLLKSVDVIDGKIDLEMVCNKLNGILSKIESKKSKDNLIITLNTLPVDLIFELLTNDSYGMMKSIIYEYIEQNIEGHGTGYVISYES